MNQPALTPGGPLAALKTANLALSFLLELVLLVAVAVWGYSVGPNPLIRLLLAIGLPLGIGIVWGIFIAPRSVIKLPRPVNFVLRLAFFGLGVLALAAVGYTGWAWVFALVVIVNYSLIAIWKQ